MNNEDDIITGVRLELSEIKGMVGQALANQASQIAQASAQIGSISNRVSSHDIEISKNTVKIENIQGNIDRSKQHYDSQISDLKSNQTGQLAKVFTIISPLLAGMAILIAVLKDVYQ